MQGLIDDAVDKGEFISFLGPSGCGKTTTLRMIAGLEKPDSGSIVFQNQDITNLPPERRGFGMVFQNYALFPHLNVFENVAFGLRARHKSKAEMNDIFILCLFGANWTAHVSDFFKMFQQRWAIRSRRAIR